MSRLVAGQSVGAIGVAEEDVLTFDYSLPTQTFASSAVQLTSTQPSARVVVALGGATELELNFSRVEDPTRQAIAITVALEVPEGDRTEVFELGAASAFPPEEPAPFVLPLSKEAQAAIAAHPDGASLLVRLTPVADQTSLREGISIVLTISGRISR